MTTLPYQILGALFGVALIFWPLLLAIFSAVRIGKLQRTIAELTRRINALEAHPPAAPAPTSAAPPVSVIPPPLVARAPTSSPAKSVNWESLLGVKGFAWIGGFAFFLGVVFFVKYSFEHNLITPATRLAIGAAVGLLLIIAGVATKRFRAPAQSLCATGVLVLYADILAAHSFYGLLSLGGASVCMSAVTFGAILLATRLDAPSVLWLAAIGGFFAPFLLWTRQDSAVALFGYVAFLNFGLAAVAMLKRWNYFIFLAALGTVVMELAWATDCFGVASADVARRILLGFEAQFLAFAIFRGRSTPRENWSAAAIALLAYVAIIFSAFAGFDPEKFETNFIYTVLFFSGAALLACTISRRDIPGSTRVSAAVVGGGLGLTWFAELAWRSANATSGNSTSAVVWCVAIFLLFAAAPYFCGAELLWPWMVAAVAGPLQFQVVYELLVGRMPHGLLFLLPLAFGIPAAISVLSLVTARRISSASADARLATSITALAFFVSAVFPVQFEHEWITLGWALEAVALLLIFRVLPNHRLRLIATVLLGAVFVRLALNPWVFDSHARGAVRIWNQILYTYGVAAVCFFAAVRLFQPPRLGALERRAPALHAAFGTIVLFLLLNLEIADYFSVGTSLTFSFDGDFARDMTYTIAWAVFAFVLLLVGIVRKLRPARFAAIGLLSLALAKLFLHDLNELSQLYRIAAFLAVAAIAICASFVYGRFLGPQTNTES